MGYKDYGLKDFEAEFIKTPAQKLAFECALARLLIAPIGDAARYLDNAEPPGDPYNGREILNQISG